MAMNVVKSMVLTMYDETFIVMFSRIQGEGTDQSDPDGVFRRVCRQHHFIRASQ
jgi:hypothetical protein